VNKYSETNLLLNNNLVPRTKYHTEKLCCLVSVIGQYRDAGGMCRRGTFKQHDAVRRSLIRHKQSTFLAGVAALALFAASGAFAQQGQTQQKGATAGAGMHSTQGTKSPSGGMKQGGMKQGGMSGQNAQSERQPGATGTNGMAHDMANGGKSPFANRSAQGSNKNNNGAGATNRSVASADGPMRRPTLRRGRLGRRRSPGTVRRTAGSRRSRRIGVGAAEPPRNATSP
jgi:hypothetical protein